MPRIEVGRYADPKAVGYQGWIIPEDHSWNLFVTTEGHVEIHTRDSEGSLYFPVEPTADVKL